MFIVGGEHSKFVKLCSNRAFFVGKDAKIYESLNKFLSFYCYYWVWLKIGSHD